jgi:hypothetical protein
MLLISQPVRQRLLADRASGGDESGVRVRAILLPMLETVVALQGMCCVVLCCVVFVFFLFVVCFVEWFIHALALHFLFLEIRVSSVP